MHLKPTKTIEHAVHELGWQADGRLHAIEFVQQVKGELNQIDDEINSRQSPRYLSGKDDMAPGAGPRIWLDSYLETLSELRILIQSQLQNGKPWSIAPDA